MLLVCVLVGVGGYFIFPTVEPIFLSSLWLNGFILGVFILGILACFWQVSTLVSSVSWIEGFAAQRIGHDLTRPPRLLAPLAALLRSRGENTQIAASDTRSILDSVGSRMDEQRDITRYLVSLLIFLGLLGTFYGLATTIPAVVNTIKSLNMQPGDTGTEVLGRLMHGLESQLNGMGTAFGSSLLGLAGSLAVGLLELFAGHGQNRFYRELEEWLSTITRVGFSSSDLSAAAGGGDTGALAMVLGQVSQQLEGMANMVAQTAGERDEMQEHFARVTAALEQMAQNAPAPQQAQAAAPDPAIREAVERMAAGNDKLVELMQTQMNEGTGGGGVDVESRMRLRSIDVQLLRILEEMSAGRQETMSDLRADINALTKAIRQATREAGQV